jgi:hypothetical protein
MRGRRVRDERIISFLKRDGDFSLGLGVGGGIGFITTICSRGYVILGPNGPGWDCIIRRMGAF